MDERGIIIADSDAKYRSQIAEHFKKAGYEVETTDSAAHVLCSILEKQTPVLLLGSDFDKKVSSGDLIHLLKKCNRHLHVIMVSEQMPLAQMRQVREEGIFYHALKPVSAGDTEELGQAVECAFEKSRAEAARLPRDRDEKSQPWRLAGRGPDRFDAGKGNWRAASWLITLALLVFGASYLSLLAVERVEQGSSTAFWVFLSFCALIIATQLVPIFRIKLPLRARKQHPASQEGSSLDQK